MPKPKIITADNITQIVLPGGSPIDKGTDQRFNIYVPSPEVVFQLGRALGSSDPGNALREPFGFDGISIAAANNLYLSVGSKPKGSNKVGSGQAFVDIQGAAIFQTRNLWQQWAGHHMVLATTRSLSGFANERVMLYAGEDIAGEPIDQEDHGTLEHNELSDEAFNTFTQNLLTLDSTFQNVVLALNAIKALAGGFLALPTSWDGWISKIATWGMGAYEWPKKIDGAFHPPSEDKHADVVIFGEEGVNLITNDEVALIAKKEVKVLGNLGIAMTTALACGIEAGVEAKIFGGFGASLGAGGYTEVTAGRKLELAALMGPVEMKGKTISIGNELEEPHLNAFQKIASKAKIPQLKTTKVEVGALEEIKLESKKEVKIAAEGKSATGQEEGEIDLGAKKKISMKVGEFEVTITDDEVSIIHAGSSGRSTIVMTKDNKVAISGELSFSADASNEITVKKGSTSVSAGAFSIKGSNVKVDADGTIKLG